MTWLDAYQKCSSLPRRALCVTYLKHRSRGYRKLRFIGGKPSLQQLKKWIDDGTVTGEIIGGVYFVDLNAELVGSKDPLLFKMLQVE